MQALAWLSSPDGLQEYNSLISWWHRKYLPLQEAEDLASRARLTVLQDTEPRPISHHVVNLRNAAAEIRRHDAQKWSERTELLKNLKPEEPISGCTGVVDAPGATYEALEAVGAKGVPLPYAEALLGGDGPGEALKAVPGAATYNRWRWNALVESAVGTPVYREVRRDGPLSGRYNSWHEGGRTKMESDKGVFQNSKLEYTLTEGES